MHVCVFIYTVHNKYTWYTHIYYVNKTFMLDAINHYLSFDSTNMKLIRSLILASDTLLFWLVLSQSDCQASERFD